MSFVKSQEHPGWIYDEEIGDYISPKGRTTSRPGSPFTGQVSTAVLKEINELVIDESEEVIVSKHDNIKLVKTIKVGDITINIFKAS